MSLVGYGPVRAHWLSECPGSGRAPCGICLGVVEQRERKYAARIALALSTHHGTQRRSGA